MTDIRFIYVTTKDADEARRLARTLLNERQIACANILPQMESIYEWQGKVCEDKEAVLILKTTAAHVASAMARIEELHSYEVPCALSYAVEAGSAGYIDWLHAQSNPKTTSI